MISPYLNSLVHPKPCNHPTPLTMVCDRIRTSFNTPTPQLQPLPIMGLAY
jgi:hypothetical protein